MSGRTFKTQTAPEGEANAEIPTQDLRPGIYFLRIDDGQKIQFLKVVKAN